MNRSTRTRRLHSQGFISLMGVALTTLLLASSSQAGSIHYTNFMLAAESGEFRQTAMENLESASGFSWAGADTDTTTSLGRRHSGGAHDGDLGQGFKNAAIIWHELGPNVRIHTLDSVYVYLGFQDEATDPQIVKVKVDGSLVFQHPTSTKIVGGSVDTEVAENGRVRVRADLRSGATNLLGSLVAVNYDAAPVPEPGSLMLFAAGAGVVALSIRNRR